MAMRPPMLCPTNAIRDPGGPCAWKWTPLEDAGVHPSKGIHGKTTWVFMVKPVDQWMRI